MRKKVLKLALPNIVSNITIPLVGMVDLAIVGQLPQKWALPAIAICTSIFGMLYYTFAFLRMTTSGLTAQSYGARDFRESERLFYRSIMVALGFAVVILSLQVPIREWALWFMEASEEVENGAAQYFNIRIWAAPATLSLYALNGWFIGMQNTRTPMYVALLINVVNVSLSYYFAETMGMGLRGVALGTLVAQYSGVVCSLLLLIKFYRKIFRAYVLSREFLHRTLSWNMLRGFVGVSGDIFIRTVCLVAVFVYFTKAGSEQGDTVLATNAILMQLFTLFSYFMDGFSYAGEALVGRYYGARNHLALDRCTRAVFQIGVCVAVGFSVLYYFRGVSILGIFTDDVNVLTLADNYIVWMVCVPLCGFGAFLWDGVLVGMTLSRQMRNTMFVAAGLFFVVYSMLGGSIGNNGLWIGFLVFLVSRFVLQTYFYREGYKKIQKKWSNRK